MVISQKQHFFGLDWLRFLACFIVVIGHARDMVFPAWGNITPEMRSLPLMGFYLLSRLGHEAVIVFFVLSGFLVGGNVLKKIQNNRFDVQKFAIDRSVRIILPLVGAVIFIAATDLIFGKTKSICIYLGNLFSLQGIAVPCVSGPFWSLNYEVWFYVICGAFAFLMVNKANRPSVKLFVWGILLFCGVLYAFLKPVYLIIFGIGAMISTISTNGLPGWKRLGLFIFSIVGIIGAVVLMQSTTPSKSFAGLSMKFYPVAEVILAGAFAMLIRLVSEFCPRREDSFLPSLLTSLLTYLKRLINQVQS